MEVTETRLCTALLDAYCAGINFALDTLNDRKPMPISTTINDIIDELNNKEQ